MRSGFMKTMWILLTSWAMLFSAQAADEIVIGCDGPLTGAAAGYGLPMQWGFELAIEDINKAGGVLGKQVKGLCLDDKGDPPTARTNIQQLIQVHKVAAIVGPVNSGNAMNFIDLNQQHKVPLMVPVATGSQIPLKYKEEPLNFVFRYTMPDNDQSTMMAAWAARKVNNEGAKIAILHDETGYGVGGNQDLQDSFQAMGVQGVSSISFPKSAKSMVPLLLKAQKAGAEVVIIYALGGHIAQTLKDADRIRFQPSFISSWAAWHPVVVTTAGKQAENLIAIASATTDQNDRTQAFHQRVLKTYLDGKDQPYNFLCAAQAYDGTRLLLQAIQAAGSTDGTAIAKALEATKSYQGLALNFENGVYTKENHEALGIKQYFMGKYKDGTISLYEDEITKTLKF